MAALVLLSILACVLVGNMGKIFRRCELAQVLHQAGMDGFRGYNLADWLCMAFHESRFNTDMVDHEADGSTDNGIFQINSRQWCDDYRSSTRNLCHMHCSVLETCVAGSRVGPCRGRSFLVVRGTSIRPETFWNGKPPLPSVNSRRQHSGVWVGWLNDDIAC
uniref:Sperm acrosome membrane-associated protein 3 n=1 Tax=Gopherus evgoodei TaxID=1825980 RepID=A0A8C4Y054_9SAUR